MGRKSKLEQEKKRNFGITIHPELNKLLEELSLKENKSKSQIIEEAVVNHLNKIKNI